jgi:anti-sigma factor RsiW
MTCERIRQLLSDYLDGELSSAVTTKVQSHLYGCAACEREHQALRRTVQLLAAEGRQRIPVDCRDLVLARLREGSETRPTVAPHGPWWRALVPEMDRLVWPQFGLARVGAVAGLALLGVGGAWFLRPGTTAPESARFAAVQPSRGGADAMAAARRITPEEELARFHAPTSIGQAMGRDNGIILVSDWVESP